MATDISVIASGLPIKTGNIVCSTQETGYSSTLDVSKDTELLIANIESKYDARFDDIVYYLPRNTPS
jgi:hypothetical protein